MSDYQNIEKDLLNLIGEWKLWLLHYKNYSINTLDNYNRDVINFILFLSVYRSQRINIDILKDVISLDVRSWFAKRKIKGISNNSNTRSLSALRSFFNYLKIYKNIVNDAADRVFIKTDKINLIKYVSDETIDNMISKLQDEIQYRHKWISSRNKAIIMLMYGCGLRISEVLNLKLNDIKDDNIYILGKGKKERVVYVHDKIRKYIKKYIIESPYHIESYVNKILFVNTKGRPLTRHVFAKDFVTIRRKFGLSENITPHSFRYTFATHLLGAGTDIRSLQEMLGHKDITTTERYTKVSKQDILDVINLKHPRNE